jgi:crossover junction endodeoxyribonuclease RuvC
MTLILAVDPGMSGSIVLLSVSGKDELKSPTLVSFLLPNKTTHGTSNRICSASIASWLNDQPMADVTHCFIEKVSAMPGQGVSSMFSFGHSAGVVEGAIAAHGIPTTLLSPQAWKKHHGLIGRDKDAARCIVSRMFPTIKEVHLKGKGQAISDAVLIGLFGASKYL